MCASQEDKNCGVVSLASESLNDPDKVNKDLNMSLVFAKLFKPRWLAFASEIGYILVERLIQISRVWKSAYINYKKEKGKKVEVRGSESDYYE